MTFTLNGTVSKKYEYTDYRERSLDSKAEILNKEFGYNGEAHTVDGLQYLRARYYDPQTMSFISADSYRGKLEDPLSQNRYTYCHNNPYKYDDPSGHLPDAGLIKYTAHAIKDDGGSSYTPPVKKTVQSQKSTVVKAVVKTDDPPAETSSQSKASNKTPSIEESPDSDDDPDIPEVDASRVKSPLDLLIDHKNQFIKSQVIIKDGPIITDDKNNDAQSVTGNIETENVGTENGVSGEGTDVEPYYYSNPFGVNYESYYKSIGIYSVPESPSVRNEFSIEIQSEDIVTIIDYANNGIGLYAEYLESNLDSLKGDIMSNSPNSTLSNQAVETMVNAIDDFGLFNELGGYLISVLSGASTYFDDIDKGKSKSQALGHAVVSEVIPMIAGSAAGVLLKTGALSEVAMLSSMTPAGAVLVVGLGTSFFINEAYENNWLGFQTFVDDTFSHILNE